MTEDGKIFDYELDWIPVSSGLDKRILFMNNLYIQSNGKESFNFDIKGKNYY